MATGDLTTLANVKLWVPDLGPNLDVTLTRMITACSAYIQNWLNRTIASASYTETRSGKNTTALSFKNYPVTAVDSVSINGISIPAATGATDCGYVFDETSLMLRGYTFCKGVQNITFTYTAGYASTPADIEQVCIQMIALRIKERQRIGEVSKSISGEVISFSQKDMSADMQTLLNQYKRVITV